MWLLYSIVVYEVFPNRPKINKYLQASLPGIGINAQSSHSTFSLGKVLIV